MASNKIMWTWTLFCLLTLGCCTDGRPTDNSFDFSNLINRTTETFLDIYHPIANHTKDFFDNASGSVQDTLHISDTVNSAVNRTAETFYVRNRTKDFFGNASDIDSNEKIVNCSIVVGGALAGAAIGIAAVPIVLALALCVLGFTCWGIMAGSAAACCQSRIGDVPSESCFSCLQGLGAGGCGWTYLIVGCVIGMPLGLYIGGLFTESYFHCFTSP